MNFHDEEENFKRELKTLALCTRGEPYYLPQELLWRFAQSRRKVICVVQDRRGTDPFVTTIYRPASFAHLHLRGVYPLADVVDVEEELEIIVNRGSPYAQGVWPGVRRIIFDGHPSSSTEEHSSDRARDLDDFLNGNMLVEEADINPSTRGFSFSDRFPCVRELICRNLHPDTVRLSISSDTLEVLVCRQNSLQEITVIGNRIREIDASHNTLRRVQLDLQALQTLDISHNPVQVLNMNCPNLWVFDLDQEAVENAKLERIYFPNLENIRNNGTTRIVYGTFCLFILILLLEAITAKLDYDRHNRHRVIVRRRRSNSALLTDYDLRLYRIVVGGMGRRKYLIVLKLVLLVLAFIAFCIWLF